MASRIRFTAATRDDLGQIYRYIREQRGSGAAARRFVHELRAKCAGLAAAPIQMGRPRTELRADLRSHPHKSYVIFFRYIGDVLEVVRVIVTGIYQRYLVATNKVRSFGRLSYLLLLNFAAQICPFE